MTNENGVKVLTDMVADFVAHIGKKLPDDVVAKLEELGSQETAALPKALYETMTKNQKLAVELNRPSCQDTGVLQFWLKCGTNFPYINELEGLLKEAVVQATFAAPLRHNSPPRPADSPGKPFSNATPSGRRNNPRCVPGWRRTGKPST